MRTPLLISTLVTALVAWVVYMKPSELPDRLASLVRARHTSPAQQLSGSRQDENSIAIDNELYDDDRRMGWDHPDHPLLWMNAVRLPFMLDHLQNVSKADGLVLDLGCGAGLLSLEVARAGYRVIGIDMSASSIEMGRTRAKREGIDIEFRVG